MLGKYQDLLEGVNLGHLATITPAGNAQVNPVWFEWIDDHLVFNSAQGRQKDRNIRNNKSIAMSIVDPSNPYRYVELRGEVVDITSEGGDAMIDRLAKRYLGLDSYPYRNPQETRVTYRAKIHKVVGMG